MAHLAFVDDHDLPRVLPVTFALAGSAVWSVVDDKPKRRAEPARVRYLRRRPRAALCIDHYEGDWSKLAWVQILGTVEVLSTADAPVAIDALTARYVQYLNRPPPGPLLRLEPERCVHWRAASA